MKNTLSFAFRAVALVAVALLGVRGDAGNTLPEPCIESVLCDGLVEVYEFEEPSDSTRFGKFMGQLRERQSSNVGVAAGKTNGTSTENALDLTGGTSSYLWSNFSGSPAGRHTIGFWLHIDTVPANGVYARIISWDQSGVSNPASSIHLLGAGGGLAQLGYCAWNLESNGLACVSTPADLSANTWYYITVGMGNAINAAGVYTGHRLFVARDAGAKTTFDFSFSIRAGFGQVRIGGAPGNGPAAVSTEPFDGRVDQLAFWARELTDGEIDLLVPSGNRRVYPFDTE